MSIISIENISKSYGDQTLLDQISFSISEKERVGLIGINGTGKSTLLKIIAGIEIPDHGSINHPKGFYIQYLPQNPSFQLGSSVIDQIYHSNIPIMNLVRNYEVAQNELHNDSNNEQKQQRVLSLQQQMDTSDAWDIVTRAKTILTKLGITNIHQQVDHLSGGQRKRVALASALIQSADLLILDEPTNHIDLETSNWLEDHLSKYTGSLLLVTHDRYFLNRVTNRILELDQGKIYGYDGNYEYFLAKKAERMEMEQASEQKRENILRRELAWLRRGAKARTTKQKARIDRIEALQDQNTTHTKMDLEMRISASRLGKKIYEIEHISKYYENQQLIHNFSHLVMPEDRIGIIGANGSGKTTLLNLLAGKITPDIGSITTGQTVKVAYYTQENMEMNENQRVLEYIKDAAEMIRMDDGSVISASQMLERFQFPADKQWTEIGRLSGGERRRLYLLRVLMGEPNVLLLDEPTNDLDIQTLSILEEYIDEFPGVVITVSHDRYFLDRVVDQIWVFDQSGQIQKHLGNYTDYLEKQKVKMESPINKVTEKAGYTKSIQPSSAPRKLSYNEQREWEEIEDRIADLEERSTQIKEQISLAGTNYEELQQLLAEDQNLSNELEHTINRWTELSELVEEIAKQKS